MDVLLSDLQEILSKTSYGLNAFKLSADDNLREQGVDSLDLLDFYLHLEEHYNVVIADEDVEGLLTFTDYKKYLEKLI